MNDTLLEACLLSQEEWINSFLPVEEHIFSRRHERKMKALFSKIRNNKYHKLTKNAVRMIIIAAIILSLAITAFAIEAIKAYRAYNVSVGTVYSATNRDKANTNENLNIGYIPDGYYLVKDITLPKAIAKEYKAVNGNKIILEKYMLTSESILDTEKYPYEEIYENNIKYIYYSYDNYRCIIWVKDKYKYNITSMISKDELLLIAFSTS
ncbi:MAG: DUF4367 domain-containing protein [Eubacterium sp.]|nr:DUF4367 domain-containing protein [Eubacterium sp.]